jgi:hypothetical protein
MSESLADFERRVASLLLSHDPASSTQRDATSDGVRIASLLVARLRFERLRHGSTRATVWFEEDPRAFTTAFKRYHRSVRPTSWFPSDEARAFEEWCRREAIPLPELERGGP